MGLATRLRDSGSSGAVACRVDLYRQLCLYSVLGAAVLLSSARQRVFGPAETSLGKVACLFGEECYILR